MANAGPPGAGPHGAPQPRAARVEFELGPAGPWQVPRLGNRAEAGPGGRADRPPTWKAGPEESAGRDAAEIWAGDSETRSSGEIFILLINYMCGRDRRDRIGAQRGWEETTERAEAQGRLLLCQENEPSGARALRFRSQYPARARSSIVQIRRQPAHPARGPPPGPLASFVFSTRPPRPG